MNTFTKALALMLPLSFSGMASAEFINADLSQWMNEGDGSWSITEGNNAYQTINGDPTVMFTGQDDRGAVIKGTIKVNTTSDDDYIGLVFGYNQGDYISDNADYYLIDWKQKTQLSPYAGKGTGYAGLALSHVTGSLGTDLEISSDGAWSHNPAYGVEELERGINLGTVGWKDRTTYDFTATFTETLLEVYIDGNKEISYSADFSSGSFGFYNYSQANVMYSQVVEAELPVTYEGGNETMTEETFEEIIAEGQGGASASNVSAPFGFASLLMMLGVFAKTRKEIK